jgi:hypothetical protein
MIEGAVAVSTARRQVVDYSSGSLIETGAKFRAERMRDCSLAIDPVGKETSWASRETGKRL